MGSRNNIWRVAAIILTVLCLVLVFACVALIRNFETTRRSHVESVYNGMIWLSGTLRLAVDNTDFEDSGAREVRLGQSRHAMEGLRAATFALSSHHMGRAGGTGFPIFELEPILQNTFRYAEDPVGELLFIVGKLEMLQEYLAPDMATREMFNIINEVSDEISLVLWWDTHFSWR